MITIILLIYDAHHIKIHMDLTSAPQITMTYTAVLGLIYAALSVNVVALRLKLDVPYGDANNDRLRVATRMHGNFAEWVPLIVLLVAGLEMNGLADHHLHMLMGALVAARILHATGLSFSVGTPFYFAGRISGALTTWLVLCTASVLILI